MQASAHWQPGSEGNFGQVLDTHPPALLLRQQDVWMCIVGPFAKATVGYYRSSDLQIDLHGDEESRIVYRHAVEEASLGLSGKQVIHPSHIHPCKVAFTPSPSELKTRVAILEAAIEADALLGGAIKFEGEMLDPPMFGKALQTLLRAHALHALSPQDTAFAIEVLRKLPEQVVRENWPYGVIL